MKSTTTPETRHQTYARIMSTPQETLDGYRAVAIAIQALRHRSTLSPRCAAVLIWYAADCDGITRREIDAQLTIGERATIGRATGSSSRHHMALMGARLLDTIDEKERARLTRLAVAERIGA